MKIYKIIPVILIALLIAKSVFSQQGNLQVYTETSSADFLDGTFSSTTVIGSGISASVALSSFTVGWWNVNWKYRRTLYVFNFVNQQLTDFQVLFTTSTKALITEGKMKNDCSDIRFVAEDNQTVLVHYIESGINTDNTKIWIKIPSLPSSPNINDPNYIKIYMYYGNSLATSVSDGSSVFDFFDDFSTDPRTNGNWDIYDRSQPTSACVWNQTSKTFSLTKNISGTAGAIYAKNYNLPTNISWQAKFRYCVTNNNNNPDGGEGMTFMFYKQKFALGSYPDTGSAMGFTTGGNASGYGVELDAVWSGETDVNNAAHFALIKNITYPHIAGTPYSTDAVRDEKWYSFILTFTNYVSSSNILARTVDQNGVAVDRINYTAQIDKTYTSIGFSAAAGGNPNEHIIDDVMVRKYVYPEPVIVDAGEDPKDFYYAVGYYISSPFDCGAPSVISSVTWSATIPSSTELEVKVYGSTSTTQQPTWIKVDNGKETEIFTNGSLIQYYILFYSTVAYLVKDKDGKDVLAAKETPVFNDITFYYKTRSAPLLNLTTVYFIEYNWEINKYVVYIDFSNSHDLDGEIVTYMWNFGDGNVLTTKEPYVTHTYYTIPTSSYTFSWTTYTITVVAIDNDGFYSYVNMQFVLSAIHEYLLVDSGEIIEPPKIYPVPKISGSSIKVARVNQPITFSCEDSYDPDGDIVAVGWYFGDYETSFTSGTYNDLRIISHTYDYIDTFYVYLYVMDNVGLSTSTYITVVVRGYPQAKITSSKHNLSNKIISLGYSESLELEATQSIYPNGKIVQYIWNLGDGNVIISTSPFLKYVYSSVTSSYNVTLTVVGDDLIISTDSLNVIVSAKPIVDVIVPVDIEINKTVVFDASFSLDVDGNIVSYVWSFGDGASASGKVVSHMYQKEGTYKVTLVVTDNVGLISSKEVIVNVSKPTVVELESSYFDKDKINIYPVPFRLSQKNLNFSYYLNEDANVSIAIYDIFGKIVKNFEFVKGSSGASAGWNTVTWDGIDNTNELVHSGTYVCKILIFNKTKKYIKDKFIVIK